MNTLETALSWLENGFSILPISYRSKRPDFRALRDTGYVDAAGKPIWEPLKESAATIEAVRVWFARPCNLGVVTGWHGLTVIDFDRIEAYTAWLSWAHTEGESVAEIADSSYRVVSARGMHLYLTIDEAVESWSIPEVLDVKARWGYVLAPPSIHPSGHIYQGMGTVIKRAPRLADVLPFQQAPVEAAAMIEAAPFADPWESADRAVECGGEGAVASVKARMRPEDVIRPVYQDRAGSWARCPLHPDKHPSLRIYSDGHWYCFQCHAHGDVIDLVAKMQRLTNREALAELRRVS